MCFQGREAHFAGSTLPRAPLIANSNPLRVPWMLSAVIPAVPIRMLPAFPRSRAVWTCRWGQGLSPCKPTTVSKSLAFDPRFEPENYSSLPTPERVRIHFYIDFKVSVFLSERFKVVLWCRQTCSQPGWGFCILYIWNGNTQMRNLTPSPCK